MSLILSILVNCFLFVKVIKYPEKSRWEEITARPVYETESLESVVSEILQDVKQNGDAAVRKYTEKFDRAVISDLAVSENEFVRAEQQISAELAAAIVHAKDNIETFHRAQIERPERIETTKGVVCWRETRAIERVGLYVPGGTAPLFSSVLMLAIPAQIAGCQEIVLCTPPNERGEIHPAILFAARLCGVTKVFKIGGVQAVGAMAYGTESVPRVYKIFGPGNQYVTCAKQMVARHGVALDMPAGPSEVAIFADETSIPAFVAADLLSQAEHGADSQVLLVSTKENVINEVLDELAVQISELPRQEIAAQALKNSRAILLETLDDAIDFLNEYAAEHLILACENGDIADEIRNAGSVFLGNYSCESAGDYASGTNHTLPTNGYARTYSGVSVDSFVTFQKLSEEGMKNLGKTIEEMAAAENLEAHKNAVTLRLKYLAENGL
jgi:histidinol dehydrogenase